jgi:hypothetical protein
MWNQIDEPPEDRRCEDCLQYVDRCMCGYEDPYATLPPIAKPLPEIDLDSLPF